MTNSYEVRTLCKCGAILSRYKFTPNDGIIPPEGFKTVESRSRCAQCKAKKKKRDPLAVLEKAEPINRRDFSQYFGNRVRA